MKETKVVLGWIMVFLMLGISNSMFGQITDEECAIIYIYRVQEKKMSGGRGLEAKIHLNGKEIGTLLSGTKLRYKMHSLGSMKLKCVAEFAGGGVGSPYVKTILFEKGKEYHIGLSIASMKGVFGEVMGKQRVKEMGEYKFFDESKLEEDTSNPISRSTENTINQITDEECAIIYIYRVQEKKMSGGRGLEAKIYLNGKEIGMLLSGTKLSYKMHSLGSMKLKCVAEFAGGGVGSPYVKTILFEKGKEYHIGLSIASMKGIFGEVMGKQRVKEMEEYSFFDALELEEAK
jgi:hypothetical protein